ncbi:hypothetical protein [Massilia oculi]|uniref:hypothetical protein n=1 Tax=Massilia oculi TaxID=945844 RepID=UPI0028B1E788|nr:hypothetical protein [Massilia oculi]
MIFRLERTAQDIEFLETSQTAITPDGIAVIRAHAEQVFSNLKYSRATIDLDVNFSADLLETRVGRQITINKISQILNFLRERISLISNENRDSQREAQRSQENSLLIGNRINSRLQAEINALSKRATIYIIIGGIIALAGGVYLYVSAQEVVNLIKENSNLSANFREIAYREIPPLILRLSVVIFVEIFAFYFLKLHKDAMESIRYYQNELTNIDLKTIALNAAYSTSDGECLEGVIKELSITERNFILKGKQTTVEIEKRKFDKYLVTEALDRLTILLKKKD